MKRLLLILILTFSFQSFTMADDIRDFQIEGMSIGDNLLDYFTKTEIENFINYDKYPSDMKFRIAEYYNDDFKMKIYDFMQVYYKPKDKKYELFGLNAGFVCNKEKDCKKRFKTITNDIQNTFKQTENIKVDKFKHPDDKSGKSLVTLWKLDLDNGIIAIRYTIWSKEMNFSNNVNIEFLSNETLKWVENNYGID